MNVFHTICTTGSNVLIVGMYVPAAGLTVLISGLRVPAAGLCACAILVSQPLVLSLKVGNLGIQRVYLHLRH